MKHKLTPQEIVSEIEEALFGESRYTVPQEVSERAGRIMPGPRERILIIFGRHYEEREYGSVCHLSETEATIESPSVGLFNVPLDAIQVCDDGTVMVDVSL